jgi:hypothetical protein
MKIWEIIILVTACWAYSCPFAQGQDPDSLSGEIAVAEAAPAKWQVRGYMKNLQNWIFFTSGPETQFLQDGLLHQRTNLRWTPGQGVTFAADVRTRVFLGDLVKQEPGYATRIEESANDVADLSLVLLDQPSWAVHTMLDRLYIEVNREKWEIRLGRQRINWGIGTVWNPNDIFNAFAFTDFDYEERPGSDALRVRYFTGFASSVEVAIKAFDRWENAVAAGLWKFNFRQFDFQLLAGYARRDFVLGAGWAGNLGNAGFKGEFSYFTPLRTTGSHAFALTSSVDYSTGKNLYLQLGYLYNSQGAAQGPADGIFAFQLSAKNLYPYRHALFIQGSYPFSPLLNGGLAAIYSPVEARALFLNPIVTISVAPDWDLDLVGQIVAGRNAGQAFESPLQAVFIRTKFSF